MTPTGGVDTRAAGRGAVAGGRVRPARRLAAVGVAVGVLGGLLLAPPSAAVAAGTAAAAVGRPSAGLPAAGTTTRGAPACQEMLFVGARGSGQKGPGVNRDPAKPDYDAGTGLGDEVYAAWRHARSLRDAGTVDYRMDFVALDYAASPTPASVSPRAWGKYIAGLQVGVDRAYAFLKARQRCASLTGERIILVGYSQGAMVMHRLYADLVTSKQTGIVNRIAGVVLIADGDRWPSDGVAHYGTASAKARGVTRQLNLGGARAVTLDGRVHSLCDAQDIVCDFRAVAARAATSATPARVVRAAAAVHATHYPKHRQLRGMLATSMARAARALAASCQVTYSADGFPYWSGCYTTIAPGQFGPLLMGRSTVAGAKARKYLAYNTFCRRWDGVWAWSDWRAQRGTLVAWRAGHSRTTRGLADTDSLERARQLYPTLTRTGYVPNWVVEGAGWHIYSVKAGNGWLDLYRYNQPDLAPKANYFAVRAPSISKPITDWSQDGC